MAIKYRKLIRWLEDQTRGGTIGEVTEIRLGGDPALRIEDAGGGEHIIRLGGHAGFQDGVRKDALRDIAEIFGKDRHWLEERVKGVPE